MLSSSTGLRKISAFTFMSVVTLAFGLKQSSSSLALRDLHALAGAACILLLYNRARARVEEQLAADHPNNGVRFSGALKHSKRLTECHTPAFDPVVLHHKLRTAVAALAQVANVRASKSVCLVLQFTLRNRSTQKFLSRQLALHCRSNGSLVESRDERLSKPVARRVPTPHTACTHSVSAPS